MAERIPGAQRASFGGTDFHRYVREVQHDFGPDFIAHQYPHRSGARQEERGDPPRRCRYTLEFGGADWRKALGEILGPMVAKPRGVLVDPIFGKLRCVLKPIQGHFLPVQKGNFYGCTLTFEEDTLDQRIQVQKGPAALSQDVGDAADGADAAALSLKDELFARYATGLSAQHVRTRVLLSQASVSTATSAARAYATAALDQYTSGVWDPSLDHQLGALPTLISLAEASVRDVAPASVYTFDVAANLEVATRAAQDLDFSIRANLPPPIVHEIREKTSLVAFVGLFYLGKSRDELFALVDHIQRINRLARADVLQPGLKLTVPAR